MDIQLEVNVMTIVSVETYRGKLRIRLSRKVITQGIPRYISTGLDANPRNTVIVQRVVLDIEEDIHKGLFEISRYKQMFIPKIASPDTTPNYQELWDKFCLYQRPNIKETTYKNVYLGTVAKVLSKIDRSSLSDPAKLQLELDRVTTPKTARRVLRWLSQASDWAVARGIITTNQLRPRLATGSPRGSSEDIDPFTTQEELAILQAFFSEYYYLLISFLFATGCRPGEALALDKLSIANDLEYITFTNTYNSDYQLLSSTTKNSTTRQFPVNPKLRELLELAIVSSPNDILFPSPRGHRVSSSVLRAKWREVLSNTSIRYRSLYHCRHTFITKCLSSNIPIATVAYWVGNTPEVIYRHYAGTDYSLLPP